MAFAIPRIPDRLLSQACLYLDVTGLTRLAQTARTPAAFIATLSIDSTACRILIFMRTRGLQDVGLTLDKRSVHTEVSTLYQCLQLSDLGGGRWAAHYMHRNRSEEVPHFEDRLLLAKERRFHPDTPPLTQHLFAGSSPGYIFAHTRQEEVEVRSSEGALLTSLPAKGTHYEYCFALEPEPPARTVFRADLLGNVSLWDISKLEEPKELVRHKVRDRQLLDAPLRFGPLIVLMFTSE